VANEEYLFRLVALHGLGKKDEATKEFDLIHERLAPMERMLWEEFKRSGGHEWEEEKARADMEKGPLYVWTAAKKIKDLYEKNQLLDQKREDPKKVHLPVQSQEVRDAFHSHWAPW
jgi:hypothetical protein